MDPKYVPNRYSKKRSSGIKKTIEKKKPVKSQYVKREKYIVLQCPICFINFGIDAVSSTKCGHVFCTACLLASLKRRNVCPLCQTSLVGAYPHQILHLDTLPD